MNGAFATHVQATVGAGLPVLSTLQALVQSGDTVHRIEGVLSGTLSFIFNGLAPGKPFSQVVAEARAAGYTEPDPREDLSGAQTQLLVRPAEFKRYRINSHFGWCAYLRIVIATGRQHVHSPGFSHGPRSS